MGEQVHTEGAELKSRQGVLVLLIFPFHLLI